MSVCYKAAMVVGIHWDDVKVHLDTNCGVGELWEVDDFGLEVISTYLDDENPIVGVKVMQTNPYGSLEVHNNLVEPCCQAAKTFYEKVGIQGKLFLAVDCF